MSKRNKFIRKMITLRRRAIQKGMRLLTIDEINEEVKARRGEKDNGVQPKTV